MSIPSTARGPFLYSRTSPRTSIPFPAVTVQHYRRAVRATSAERLEGEPRRDDGLPVALVRDVHRVVLPIRAGDADPRSTASARSRACPPSSARARRRACGRRCGSRAPSAWATPFTNTSNGRTTSAGSRTRVPRYSSSGTFIEWQPVRRSSSSAAGAVLRSLAVVGARRRAVRARRRPSRRTPRGSATASSSSRSSSSRSSSSSKGC